MVKNLKSKPKRLTTAAMKVIVIIGDIVASKALPRRAAFQRRLGTTLAGINRGNPALASPYTITLGDEFQAVYRSAERLWIDIVEILAAIHPVEARFAIGVGELSTRLNPRQALGMDGPAFHRARAAITALKHGSARLRIAAEDEMTWSLANHALAHLSHYLDGWSRTRLQILAGLLRGRAVRDLETSLKISKVAIYKNINAAALDEVVAICQDIERALSATLHA
jgi:hypothetical protein